MVARGIHGDLRRRRPSVCRYAGSDRPVHAQRRRAESEAPRQPQQRRRRLGGRRGALVEAARARAPAGHRAGVHELVQRGEQVTAWAAREHHRFDAAGRPFVYLVPSAGIFELDDAAASLLRALAERPRTREELSAFDDVDDAIAELTKVQAIREVHEPPPPVPKIIPLAPFPLTTMVLNVTNQCNLSCTYCYEYGEDKIVDTENGKQPKFMSEETARASVDFMLKESGTNELAHVTFFGGETLLNFPVLVKTVAYARQRGAELGKKVDFSLTTNATLLKPEIIEFIAENQIGVTISIDGPREVQDKFRVFNNGAGSYDLVAPKIRELLKRHRSRPIGARVTLTSANMDVTRIFRHLIEDIGFWEVGFAPVTTAAVRGHAISDEGSDRILDQFRD